MVRLLPLRLISIAFTFFLLASCAAIKEKTAIEPAGWLEQQRQRQQIKMWEIRGRLGVQTQTTGGSLDIIWKQAEQDYSIRLILPLGAGSYLIQGNDRYANVRFPNGNKKTVDNINTVFSSVLGQDLPVAAIKDWVRGLPAKSLSIDSIKWDEQGVLNNIKQAGWSVEMTNYSGNDLLLPYSIYISRNDDTELDIRLILRQWLIDN